MGLLDFLKKGEEKPVKNTPSQAQQTTSKPVNPVNTNNQAASPKPAQPVTQQKTYTVKSGDSLSKIAKQFYGDANQWKKIHQANADKIKDPNLIHPGEQLIIP